MRIDKTRIENFIPMGFGGISELEIETLSNTMCIIGTNGSGKSSLLRELLKSASTKPDYEKNGLKLLSISHEGQKFEIGSDFSVKGGAHIFRTEDGTNLNESGTSGVQMELWEKYLGVSPQIHALISNNVHVAQMKPGERKAFLMKCYPSDLSFVLDKHKKIASKIRSVKSIITDLTSRKSDIADKMMNSDNLKVLEELQGDLQKFMNDSDTTIYSLNEDIRRSREQQDTIGINPNFDMSTVQARLTGMINKFNSINVKDSVKWGDHEEGIRVLGVAINTLKSLTDSLVDKSHSLEKEIQEFEATLAQQDETENIELLQARIARLQQELSGITVDENIPSVPGKELVQYKQRQMKVKEVLMSFIGAEVKLIPMDELAHLNSRRDVLKHDLEGMSRQLHRLDETIEAIEIKKVRLKDTMYPDECNFVCNMKTEFIGMMNTVDKELTDAKAMKEDLVKDGKAIKKEIDEIGEKVDGPNGWREFVTNLANLMEWNTWGNYVLGGDDVIEVLNDRPYLIINRMQYIASNSEASKYRKEYEEELSILKYKVEVITKSTSGATKLLRETYMNRRNEFSDLGVQLSNNRAELILMSKEINAHIDIQSFLDELEVIETGCRNFAQYQILDRRIEFINIIIREIDDCKNIVRARLNDVDLTLKQQQDLGAIYNNELLPNIKKQEARLYRLTSMELSLSPSRGFAHVNMVRFLNGVITNVNEYIRMVWTREMELDFLDESKPLDYTFRVRFDKAKSVKDIGICSKGQKEMIDLAFTLALCHQMKIGQKYPILVDEPDSGMADGARSRLLELFNTLILRGDISQLILVNHHAGLFSSFANAQIVCLGEDDILLPNKYNEGVKIA